MLPSQAAVKRQAFPVSALELFHLHLAALADDADVFLEGVRGRMIGEAGLVLPRFAEHEDAGARGALENIVGDAAGMGERFADESLRGGDRLGVAAFLGLERPGFCGRP